MPHQCETYAINPEKVKQVKTLLDDENPTEVAEIFKALSDPTRIKLVFALRVEASLCVCDLAHVCDMSTATTSHHLRLLYKYGLVRAEKRGKEVYYQLDDDHVKQILDMVFAHQKEGRMRHDEV